jgi:hypothetical protein
MNWVYGPLDALTFKDDGPPESLVGDGLNPAMVCFIGDGIGVANVGSTICLSPLSPWVSKLTDVEVVMGLGSTLENALLSEEVWQTTLAKASVLLEEDLVSLAMASLSLWRRLLLLWRSPLFLCEPTV